MKFFNAKKIMGVATYGLVFGAVTFDCTPKAIAVNQNQSEPIRALQHVGGKKLACPEMDLLNAFLAVDPMPVFRIDLAHKATLKVTKELETVTRTDKEFVAVQIKSILAPVKQFFSYIHEYAGMVKPLIELSLVNKETGIDASSCLILKFLASKDDADTFFNKNVGTRSELVKACKEFTIFFEDIKMSLSESVMQAYNATLEKLKNNKKQSASRK